MKRNAENITQYEEPDWRRLLKPYREQRRARALLLLLEAFGPALLFTVIAYLCRDGCYPVTLVFCVLAGLSMMRIFSVQHDIGHGSFTRDRRLADALGFCCGVITLTPYQYWRRVHHNHHRHTANLSDRDHGDFPIMTVDEYQRASRWERLRYRVMRHPAFLLGLIPALLFFVIQRLPIKVDQVTPSELRSVHWTNVALLGALYVAQRTLGWGALLEVQLPIYLSFSTCGIFLFFIHHQYEDAYWADESERSFYLTAIRGSAHLDFGPILNWFMGHTEYHHIHHLSPSIPSYQLQRAHQDHPCLHPRQSMTLSAAVRTFRFTLWDRQAQRLVRFEDVSLEP